MFKIITDSACDVPTEFIAAEQLQLIPLHITIHGQTLEDTKNAQQVSDFYKQLQAGSPATTSQINVGEFVACFTEALKGQQKLLYLGFSSAMSGTFSSAVAARELVLAKNPQAEIELVDSRAACGAMGLMVMRACQMRANGQSLKATADWLTEHRLMFNHLFTLSNLDYLVRGGRLSKSSAMMGQLLHIQPILGINPDGKIEPLRKTRSMKKSLQSMADQALAEICSDRPAQLLIATSDDQQVAEQLKQLILAQLPDAKIAITPIGITLASHTGPNCTAIFYESLAARQ